MDGKGIQMKSPKIEFEYNFRDCRTHCINVQLNDEKACTIFGDSSEMASLNLFQMLKMLEQLGVLDSGEAKRRWEAFEK